MAISNALRAEVERAIVRRVIRGAAMVGFTPIKVWDGGEYVDATTERRAIDAVFSVDESTLHFADHDGHWGAYGVLLICGNGEDIVSDWHCHNAAFNTAVQDSLDAIEEMRVR